MTSTVAVNGSRWRDRGGTSLVLNSLLQGVRGAGSTTEVVCANALTIKPCDCGTIHCWYTRPGKCVHRDDMESAYSLLAQADLLVLATPVYIPLPGEMQNLINRLCIKQAKCLCSLRWRTVMDALRSTRYQID